MIKLYAPLGKVVMIGAENKRPAVLLESKVYDNLPYLEMAMYTAMQWHICDQENMEDYYYKKTLTNRAFADGKLDECVENLRQKGLIACVEKEEDVAALYHLLAWRSVRFNAKTMDEYLANYRMLREKHVPIRVALQVFKRPRLTKLEKKVLDYVKTGPEQCMYELILALNKKEPPNNFKQPEALFYLRLVDEQQECLSAILSLFLKKQIVFV